MDSGRTNSRKGRTDRGESQNSYLDDFYKQELNITPKPTKNKTKEALKVTQSKEAKNVRRNGYEVK